MTGLAEVCLPGSMRYKVVVKTLLWTQVGVWVISTSHKWS